MKKAINLEVGCRYLLTSYGPLSHSGVLTAIHKIGGTVLLALDEVTAIGEVGSIAEAQTKQVYEQGQSGPVPGGVLVPLHDVSGIYPQG